MLINNLQLGGYCHPYLYVVCLLVMPLTLPRWVDLVIGALVGLTLDAFCNSAGVHMAACTMLMLIRPYLIERMVVDSERLTDEINVSSIGMSTFSIYAAILIASHHALVFLLTNWFRLHPIHPAADSSECGDHVRTGSGIRIYSQEMINDNFYKRQYVISGMAIFVVVAYIVLLFNMQVIETSSGSVDGNAIIKQTIYPARGLIYDRNDSLLVYNQPIYEVMMTMNEMSKDFDTLAFCHLLRIDKQMFDQRIEDLHDTRKNPGWSTWTQQVFMSHQERRCRPTARGTV